MKLLQVFCVLFMTTAWVTGEQFSLDIREQGTDFTEDIVVDETQNTETIDVPQHNDVAAAKFIHDFNRNLTLRVLHETEECFVTDLADMIKHGYLVPPRTLKANLKAGQARSRRSLSPGDSEVEIILQEWAVGRPLDDDELASLSDSMREACPSDNIRWLFRLKDSAVVRSGSERAKRSSPVHFWDNLRQPAVHRRDVISTRCRMDQVLYRCQIFRKSCQYIFYQNCNAERYQQTSRTSAHCKDSNTLHIIDEVRCCRECCTDQSKADSFFPYCNSFQPTC